MLELGNVIEKYKLSRVREIKVGSAAVCNIK